MGRDVYRIRSWRFARRLMLRLAFAPVTAAAIFFSVYLRTSPFPPEAALLHLLAAQSCGVADALGVAPARVGAPGYHAKFDADGDGIACESVVVGGQSDVQAAYRGGAKFVKP